jgi:hypothetical protein
MWGQLLSMLLGSGEKGNTGSSNMTNKKLQYYQQLMSMMNPSFQGSFKSQGKIAQGQDDLGINDLMNLFGGRGNTGGSTSSYNLPASTNYDNWMA